MVSEYGLILSNRAVKSFKNIPEDSRQRITRALRAIRTNPLVGKKLRGKMGDYYKLRVWPYRIIYSVHKKQCFIFILDIAHRQGAYK